MKVVKMCCNDAGVFVQLADESMWWRRHEWLSERWQFVAPPGRPEAKRRRSSVTTATRRRAPRR